MIGMLLLAVVASGLVRAIRHDRIRDRLPSQGATPVWRIRLGRESLAGLGAGFALDGLAGAWLGLAAGIAAAIARARIAKRRRLQLVAEQVPDLVRSLSANLRVAGSLPLAFAAASAELREPLATPLRRLSQRLATGASIDETLDDLAADVPIASIERLVEAIRTSVAVGGALRPVLVELAEQVRDHVELERERRAALAQGRMSAVVVGGMPLAFVAMTGFDSDGPARLLLTEPAGWALLAAGLLLEAAGFWWVSRLGRV